MYGPKLSAVNLGCILCYSWIRILQGHNIGHFGFYSVFGRLGLGLNWQVGAAYGGSYLEQFPHIHNLAHIRNPVHQKV